MDFKDYTAQNPLENVMGHLMGHLNAAFKCSAYQLYSSSK